ncbi:MAG: hypothetical protein WC642_04720 [Nocardioides sp.]
MSQMTLDTLAVAVTETGPSLADRVMGPHVFSVWLLTHIQTGSPTSPTRFGADSGTMPIVIGSRFMAAIARFASTTGSIVTVPFWIHTGSHDEPGGGQ